MKEQEIFENLTGCVVANFTALHYNETIKHTRFYKHNLKRLINPLIKELIKIEKNEYDAICDSDTDNLSPLSENNISFIEEISKQSFKGFMQLQNIIIANDLDQKRMGNIAIKIINEHNEQ